MLRGRERLRTPTGEEKESLEASGKWVRSRSIVVLLIFSDKKTKLRVWVADSRLGEGRCEEEWKVGGGRGKRRGKLGIEGGTRV